MTAIGLCFRPAATARRGLIRDALVAAIGLPARTGGGRPADYPAARVSFGVGEPRPPADLALLDRAAGPPGVGVSGPADFAPAEAAFARPALSLASHRYLGQALATYLVLEAPGGLLLLDQHAAHERVLFERLRQMCLDGKLERQALLLPVRLELPRSSADALEQHAAALERAGFELEFGGAALRGGAAVAVRTVPALLGPGAQPDWPALLEETAASLRDPSARTARDGIDGALHGILATAACHSAVRKGDRLTPEEVQGLLEGLDETIWFPNCPHGRPILVSLTEGELERRFARR